MFVVEIKSSRWFFESWIQFMKKNLVKEFKQLGTDHWVTSIRFLHARVYNKEFILVCELKFNY